MKLAADIVSWYLSLGVLLGVLTMLDVYGLMHHEVASADRPPSHRIWQAGMLVVVLWLPLLAGSLLASVRRARR